MNTLKLSLRKSRRAALSREVAWRVKILKYLLSGKRESVTIRGRKRRLTRPFVKSYLRNSIKISLAAGKILDKAAA